MKDNNQTIKGNITFNVMKYKQLLAIKGIQMYRKVFK